MCFKLASMGNSSIIPSTDGRTLLGGHWQFHKPKTVKVILISWTQNQDAVQEAEQNI